MSSTRGGLSHATGSVERQARASVRAHQGVGEEAGPLDEARKGDRGGHREQAASGVRRDQEVTRLGRTVPRRYAGDVKPKTMDHVAFWVADREPIVNFLTQHVGMHVIDRQDAFTLVGSDARRGKLTLFTAEGPREQGAFKHVALRVSDLNRARVGLPDGVEVELGEGVRVRLVEAPTDVEYDLDHVAVLVDEVDPVIAEAEKRDIVDNVVDAANTRAVFVWGPERVRIEYVEHKPGFAL